MKIFTLLIISTLALTTFAEDVKPMQPEKYNGYGLPNTKFKKVSVAPKAHNPQGASRAEPKETESIKKEDRGYSLGVDLSPTYSIQAEKHKDGSQTQFIYYELNPWLQVGDYKFTGLFYYNQNLKEPSDQDWDDSVVFVNRKAWEPTKLLMLTPYLNFGLPLSKTSREKALITGTVGPSFALGLNSKEIGLPQLTLIGSTGYTKMFTRSNLNSAGEANVNYRLRQKLTAAWALTDSLAFKVRFQFDSVYDYDNYVTNAFLHFEQFEYKVNDHLGLNLGHTNSNGLFNPETYENNLKFYDKESSEIYAGFTVSISY